MRILLALLISLPIYYAIDFSNVLVVVCLVALQVLAGTKS